MKKLFVSNLAFSITENEISDLFKVYGTIISLKMIKDRETGKFKGFAFIEMSTDKEAESASIALHNKIFKDREIKITWAKPKEENFNQEKYNKHSYASLEETFNFKPKRHNANYDLCGYDKHKTRSKDYDR